MFKEFAVEPEAVVRSDRDLVYVLEKFGMHQGRVISEFPRKWKRLAYEAAQRRHKGQVELTRITERLQRIPEGVLVSSGRPAGEPTMSWIARANAAHATMPFDAIVAEAPPPEPPFVQIDLLDETHPCLSPNRQWPVRREATQLAAACRMHLRTARHLKLIDPHFDLFARRFRRPFEAMLLEAAVNRPTIDIYRNDDLPPEEAVRRMDRCLTAAAQQGFTARLFLRAANVMHNRFVLSDRGGLSFLTGLDDDGDGVGTPEDDVTLLDPPLWCLRWQQYDDLEPVAQWLRSCP